MLIGGRKYKKVIKKNYINSNNIMLFCYVTYQTSPISQYSEVGESSGVTVEVYIRIRI
jgi:ribosome biogenesis protein Nip4